jgi:hypothetical protein
MSVLSHINQRVKANRQIQLPVRSLILLSLGLDPQTLEPLASTNKIGINIMIILFLLFLLNLVV